MTTGKGLFGVRFRNAASRRIPIIRDEEDGVNRCPVCTWELEDGLCENCNPGFSESSGSELSDSDESIFVGGGFGDDAPNHLLADDDASNYRGPGAMYDELASLDRANSVGWTSDTQSEGYHPYARQAPARARLRNQDVAAASRSRRRRHDQYSPQLLSDVDYDENEGYQDTEQHSSDDTAGSLLGFIADDQSELITVEDSPRSSLLGFDEGADGDTHYSTDNNREGFSPFEPSSDEQTETAIQEQHSSDSDSDEGPLVRRRLRSVPTDSYDNDSEGVVMRRPRSSRTERADWYDIRTPMTNTHSLCHSNPQMRELGQHRGPQREPIDIGSDSDLPVPIPRARRNRQVVNLDSSDDNAGRRNSVRSTSYDTVLRPFSASSSPGSSNGQNSRQSRVLSPSSAEESHSITDRTNAEGDQASGRPFRSHVTESRITIRDSPYLSEEVPAPFEHDPSSSRIENRNAVPRSRRSPLQNRRNYLVVSNAPRNRISSTGSSPSGVSLSPSPYHPHRSGSSRWLYRDDEARRIARAERKRTKQERRRRNREPERVFEASQT